MKNSYEHLGHIPSSITYLASNLNEGNVVLFLGAGTSKGFGLPDWVSLVNGLRRRVGLSELDAVTSTAQNLQHGADEVLDEIDNNVGKLISYIEEELYPNFDNLSITDVFDNHLLVAISALLMGGKRGRVTRVITLNYDSMLEWFLSLFGFVVKTIHTLPELEGSEDVRIYHPHGFVPIPNKNMKSSDFIILGLDSVNTRWGEIGEPWLEMTRHLLNTGLCLFIGMSENTLSDAALAPLFNNCGKKCMGVRPLGIWLLGHDISLAISKQYARNNIVPVVLSSYSDIPEYLLKICQEAREALNK